MNRYNKIRDFHAQRATGVGSSDIPTLAGLNRAYGETTLTLWQSKTGRAEPWAGNNRTAWGKKLEGIVLREFVALQYGEDVADDFFTAKRRGRSVGPFKSDTEARHPERPYCIAHADLLIDMDSAPILDVVPCGGDPFIVEGKTSGMMAGKRREGEIFRGYDPDDLSAQGLPDGVFLQVQWQMYVYDVPRAFVAVLIDTADFRVYGPINANPRVQEKCLALAERFWRLVETDTTPAPETWDDVQRLFPDQKDTTAMVGGEAEDRVRDMIYRDKDLAARIKALETERDDIKNAIGILLGENSVLAAADGSVLARSTKQSKESIAPAKVAEVAPDIEKRLRELGLINTAKFRVVRY